MAAVLYWPRERMVAAVQAFVEREQRLPVSRDLCVSQGLPSPVTIRAIFQPWERLLLAAGYVPPPRAKPGAAGRAAQKTRKRGQKQTASANGEDCSPGNRI